MKYIYILTWPVIMCLLLLGCSTKTPEPLSELDHDFVEKFPISDMNQSLQIELDGSSDTFPPNTDIPFLIYNYSNRDVSVADSNLDIKLLMAAVSDWIEIENALTYEGEMYFAPHGTELLDVRYSWVQPVLSDDVLNASTNKIMVRILITGEFLNNAVPTGEFAAAYEDVFIGSPK